MGEKIDIILERFYKKEIDLLEVRKELLILFSVSNRRELLIAYGEWIHELAGCKDTEKATTLADKIEKENQESLILG